MLSCPCTGKSFFFKYSNIKKKSQNWNFWFHGAIFHFFFLYLVHRQWTRQGRAPTVIWWRVGPLQQSLMLYPEFTCSTSLQPQQKVTPSPPPPVWPSPGTSPTVMEQKSLPTASQWETTSSPPKTQPATLSGTCCRTASTGEQEILFNTLYLFFMWFCYI